jgi:adenylate cyclase
VRVQRCFGFVDLCGFTSFTERQGDERAVVVLAEFRSALREIAARRGVRIVKWLGDGAMIASSDPDTVVTSIIEINARMETALPTLALRAGIDIGPVIMFEGDDYIGRPVNVASRLCDQAHSHELLATTPVTEKLSPWIQIIPRPAAAIRGLDRSVDLVALAVAPSNGDGVTDPVCKLTIPRSAAIQADSMWFCSVACRDSSPAAADRDVIAR